MASVRLTLWRLSEGVGLMRVCILCVHSAITEGTTVWLPGLPVVTSSRSMCTMKLWDD